MSSTTDSQPNVNLEQQRKRAKDLRRAHGEGSIEAAIRIAHHLPRAQNHSSAEVLASPFTLSEAQLVVAREAGFQSWPLMKREVDKISHGDADNSEMLIDATLGGNDDAVRMALDRDPLATRQSIYAAAAVADAEAVSTLLDADKSLADRHGGRREWTPLLYLCCSRYRRNEPEVTAARIRIARELIGLGADVNAAGREPGFANQALEWRSLSGAANSLASPELVRLLVFAGAAIGKTPAVLVHAVRGGNIEVMRLFLEGAPEDWFEVIWGLQECVVLQSPEMARMLVAHAAHSQHKGSTMAAQTALLEAIRLQRNAAMIDILLGGDDHSEFSRPVLQNVYRHSVRYGHETAAEVLRRHGADDAVMTPADRVIGAAVAGHRATFRQLIEESTYSKSALREQDNRMLAWAIRSGRHQAIPLLLEAGLDPDVPDKDGEMPLHLAVRAGSLDLVDALIRAGAAVDARNFDAQTPLDIAVIQPDAGARGRLAKRLLNAGAVEVRRSDTAKREDPDLLFERAADAVAFGDIDTLRQLLNEHPELVHARSPRPHRCTLLNYCGANGTEAPRQRTPGNAPAIAQLLLERGADPDATCNLYGGGHRTLGLLLTSTHPKAAGVDGEIVRVLARFGAKFETTDLLCALEFGAASAVDAIAEAGVPIDNLFVAAGLDRADIMEDLLSRGSDINERYADGGYGTALHAAAAAGRKMAVSFLLDRGADPSLHNKWEATPADTAWHFDHRELAEFIEERCGQLPTKPMPALSSRTSEDTVSGSWGAEGATLLELEFDCKGTVSGTLILRAGPRQETRVAIKTGTFEPKTGSLALEGEAKGPDGVALKYMIEAKLDKDTLTGSLAIGNNTENFKFTKI